jgi:hypothetical protein
MEQTNIVVSNHGNIASMNQKQLGANKKHEFVGEEFCVYVFICKLNKRKWYYIYGTVYNQHN